MYIHRATNGLLAFLGDRPLSGIFDSYAVIGLLNGRVFMSFNDFSGLPQQTIDGTSQELYNDGEIHRVNFTFDSGELGILVDNIAISLQRKSCSLYYAMTCLGICIAMHYHVCWHT